jgi:acyl CoA:acetate/3-ketoacid CoA transferase alpha subunit
VEVGDIAPETIHTPSLYVDHIYMEEHA